MPQPVRRLSPYVSGPARPMRKPIRRGRSPSWYRSRPAAARIRSPASSTAAFVALRERGDRKQSGREPASSRRPPWRARRRWLHAADGDELDAFGQSVPVQVPLLRSVKDFAPVARAGSYVFMRVVNKDLPAKNAGRARRLCERQSRQAYLCQRQHHRQSWRARR